MHLQNRGYGMSHIQLGKTKQSDTSATEKNKIFINTKSMDIENTVTTIKF